MGGPWTGRRADRCRRRSGKVATKKMPNIQVFGTEDTQATRAALRFFRERRIVVHFVDLRKKPIAAGELRRFTDRLGAARAAGHREPPVPGAAASPTSRRTPPGSRPGSSPTCGCLKLPLVRYGDDVTAGKDEATWRAWLARPR